MAVRLGKYCGNGPRLWLRLQRAHDLWQAEAALQRELRAIPDRSRSRIKQLSRESKARIGSKRWNRDNLHER